MLVEQNKNQNTNTEFISLMEATRYCSYTQEYLSLRARQGKLKSVKIGRNWMTKKEWVEEYEKNSSDTPQGKRENLISLEEASHICSYTQEYLSLRARQGKLRSVKIGRNWMTRQEWVEEYEKGNLEFQFKTTKENLDQNSNLNSARVFGKVVTVHSKAKSDVNIFDRLLKNVNIFDVKKIKTGFSEFVDLSQKLFSDLGNNFRNISFAKISQDKKLPTFKFNKNYSLDQFIRSLNFSVALVAILIITKTFSPLAIASFSKNENSIKESTQVAVDKLFYSYKNNLENLFEKVGLFNESLKSKYIETPEQVYFVFNSSDYQIDSYKNNLVKISEDFNVLENGKVNVNKLQNKFLSYSSNLENDQNKSRVLGMKESVFSKNGVKLSQTNIVLNILDKINFYRQSPYRFSIQLTKRSENANLAFWKNFANSITDLADLEKSQNFYSYNPDAPIIQNYYSNSYGDTIIQNVVKSEGISIAGPMGPRGVAGNNGTKGDKGAKGDIGATGPAGPMGPSGSGGGSTTIIQNGASLESNNTWTNTNTYTAQVLMRDLSVSRFLAVENLSVSDALTVSSDTNAGVIVTARARFEDDVIFNGNVTFANAINISGNQNISGNLAVSGITNLSTTSISNDLTVSGTSTFANIIASEISVMQNGITIASSTPLVTANTLYNINGILYWNGDPVGVGTGVASSSFVDGDFTVTGTSTLATTTITDLTVSGTTTLNNLVINGNTTLGNLTFASTTISDLNFTSATGTNLYVSNLISVIGGNSLQWNESYNIVSASSSFWDDAYSWGDHSLAGYLTSYTESDPYWSAVSTSLSVSNFATSTIRQWTNDADYLTVATASSMYLGLGGGTISGNLTVNGTSTLASTTISNLLVNGVSTFNNNLEIGNNSILANNYSILLNGIATFASTTVNGQLAVTSGIVATGTINLAGNIIASGDLQIQGNTTLQSLTYTSATGTTLALSSLTVSSTSNLAAISGTSLNISGSTNLNELTVASSTISNNFVVLGVTNLASTTISSLIVSGNTTTTGDQVVSGNLNVFGTTTLNNLAITGGLNLGNITIASTSITNLTFNSATGTNLNIDTLTFRNASGISVTSTNLFASILRAVNATIENTITALIGRFTNLESEHTTSTELVAGTATVTSSLTSLGITNLATTTLSSTTLTTLNFTSATGTNLYVSNLISVIGGNSLQWNESYNIVSASSSFWDDAYSWGDHSLAGYLTSYTESDPYWSAVSTSLSVSNFATSTIRQWTNDADYLTVATASSMYLGLGGGTISGNLTVNGTSTLASTTISNLLVNGVSTFNNNLEIGNNSILANNYSILLNGIATFASTTVNGQLAVTSGIVATGTINLAGNIIASGDLQIQGNTTLQSLTYTSATGTTLALSSLTVSSTSNLAAISGTSLNISGSTNLNELTVASSTISNNFVVLGFTNLASTTISQLSVTNSAYIGGNATITRTLFVVDNNTLYVDSVNHKVGIGTSSLVQALNVAGTIRTTDLAGEGLGNRCLYVSPDGDILAKSGDCGTATSTGDDFGTHIATQNIRLGNYWLSGDGGNEGIKVDSNGNVGVNVATPLARLNVGGTTEQLRLSYDVSNYSSFTVSSTGNLTIAPSGLNTYITGKLYASSDLIIGANATISAISGNIETVGSLSVVSTSTLGNIQISGSSIGLSGNANLLTLSNSGLNITGVVTSTNSYVTNNLIVGNNLNVFGTSTLASTSISNLTVTGLSTLATTTLSSTTVTGNFLVGTSLLFANVLNGRIGIGTTTPAFTLDVNGIVNAKDLYVNGSQYTGSQWTTFGNSIYYNSGNVGIGTTTPNAGLHIVTSTTQLTLGYDSSNYSTLSTNSSGDLVATSASGKILLGNTIVNISADGTNLFVGSDAGFGASSVSNSNFLGQYSGARAENAADSNFFGQYSGDRSTNASNSNFFGQAAGARAEYASNSNFFGQAAGAEATNASNSNFFGQAAGAEATNASNSNFLGYYAGSRAINASDSIFIGTNAGNNDGVDNTQNYGTSILIGRYTSTGGYSDSIAIGRGTANSAERQLNIGNVLYGTGIYNHDATNPTPIVGGRIGIGIEAPSSTLHVVSNSTTQFTLGYSESKYVTFGTNSFGDLRVTPNGGTTTLASNLFVTGTSNLQNLQVTNATTTGNLAVVGFTNLATTTINGNLTINGTVIGTGLFTSSTINNLVFANATGTQSLVVTGYTTLATTTLTRNVIPDMTGSVTTNVSLIMLGDETHQFKDIYTDELHLGPSSLYVNGKKVIQDNSNVMNFTTSPDQSLKVITSGNLGALGLESQHTISLNSSSTLSMNSKESISLLVPNDLDGKGISIQTNSSGGSITLSALDGSSQILSRAGLRIALTAPTIDLYGTTNIHGSLSVTGTITNATWGGNIIGVPYGGTGTTTFTSGGILLGNGTGEINATRVFANGELLIGDGTGAPTIGTLTQGSLISIVNGAGSIAINHAVSSALGQTNLGGTVIQSIALDNYGHISTISSTSLDNRYHTTSSADSLFVNVSGDTMTGNLIVDGTSDFATTTISNLIVDGGVTTTINGLLFNGLNIAVSGNSNLLTLSNTGIAIGGVVTSTGIYNSGALMVLGNTILASTTINGTLQVNGNATTTGNQVVLGFTNLVSTTIAGAVVINGTVTTTIGGDVNFDSNTLVIDSVNNRVGIGIANPALALEINGSIRVGANGYVSDTGGSRMGYLSSGVWGAYSPNADFRIRGYNGTSVTDVLYADTAGSTGFIGIGTTTPNYKLSVVSSSSTENLLQIATTTNQGIFVVNSDGNVGIGTTTPRFTLDVNGVVNATALYVNGSPYIGSQWTTNGASIYYNIGNVGIGTTTPNAGLHVVTTTTQLTLENSAGNYTNINTNANGFLTVSPSGASSTIVGSLRITSGLVVSGNATTSGNQIVSGNLNVSGISTLATTTIASLSLSGSLNDSTNSAGSDGMVLRSTGTSTQWVSTSTIVGGNALVNLNGLTSSAQNFATGTSGNIFNIVSSGSTHTFNMPIASSVNTGQLQNSDWSMFNNKLSGAGVANYLLRYVTATTTATSSVYDNGTIIGLGSRATITVSSGDITTLGTLSASGTLAVTGNATMHSDLRVVGTSTLGNVQITGNNIGLVGNADLLTLANSGLQIDGIVTSTQMYVSGNAVVAGTLFVSDGSSTTPSIAFIGDPDTGFYRYSDNTISITAGSNEAMRISDTQISMFNPVSFEAVGNVAIANDLIFTNSSASYIKSESALYVQTNSAYLDLNLVLSAANLGDVIVDDTLIVTGTSTLATTTINGTLVVNGNATTTGNQAVSGNLTVGGTINGSFISTSSTFTNLTFGSATGTNLYVSGNTSLASTSVAGTFDATGIISAFGGNSMNWNSAYGWGNHADAGYLLGSTASTIYLSLSTWFSTTTLPSNIVNSSLTGVGVLNSGSINTGFGTILTNNTITGSVINGTTGINTGADSGTQRIDASGNLVNIGTISSGLINGQTISSSANFTGTLTVVGTSTLATSTISQLAVTNGLNVSGFSILANLQVTNATTTGNLAVFGFTNLASTTITGSFILNGVDIGNGYFSSSTISNLAFTNATGTQSLVILGNTTLATTTVNGNAIFNGNTTTVVNNFLVGANDLFVNHSNGYVGIGTTTPSSALHILNANAQLKLGYDSLNYTNFQNSGGGLDIHTYAPAVNHPYTRFSFNSNDGLDIGSFSDINEGGFYEVNGDGVIAGFDYDDNRFVYGGRALTINLGDIGIGTSTPTSKLTVSGDTLLYGNATTTGNLVVSGFTKLASTTITGNLSITGNSTITGNQFISNNLQINNNLKVAAVLSVGDFITLDGQGGNITGASALVGNPYVGELYIGGDFYGDDLGLYDVSNDFMIAGKNYNTGIYQYGGAFSSSDGLFINNGNVGIGTSTPTSKLTVSGDALLYGNATTTGSHYINNLITESLNVSGVSMLDSLTVSNTVTTTNLIVTSTSTLGNMLIAGNNIGLSGNANLLTLLTSGLNISGVVTSTNSNVTNNLVVGNNLNVLGVSTLASTTVTGAFAVNTNQLYINPLNGYVGIGTTSPQYALDVYSSDNYLGQLRANHGIFGDRYTSNYVNVGYDILGGEIGMSWNVNDELIVGVNSAQTAYKFGGYSDDAGISVNINSGYIGIGTTTPLSRLTVSGDALLYGNGTTTGSYYIGSALNVSGLSTLANLQVTNATTTGNLAVLGITNLASTTITGSFILNGVDIGNGYFSSSTISNLAFTNATGTNSLVMLGNTTLASTTIAGSFSVNTNQLYVNPLNGYVGIGTVDPGNTLHVSSSDSIAARFTSFDSSRGGLYLGNNNSYSTDEFGLYDAGGDMPLVVYEASPDSMNDVIHYNNISVNPSTGNVGIGTTTPAFTLDVNGIVNATDLYVNGSKYIGSQWTSNGNSIYYNTGNVGIGTTTPNAGLHIVTSTTQLTLGYDSSNYSTLATDNYGNLVISPSGNMITFAPAAVDSVNIVGDIQGTGKNIIGLYSSTGDQVLAEINITDQTYTYGNGALLIDEANSNSLFSNNLIIGSGATITSTGIATFATTTVTGLIASNNGVSISSSTPIITTNTLYNLGGNLYWNGSAVGSGAESDPIWMAASSSYALLSGANFSGDISVGGRATITASSGDITTVGKISASGTLAVSGNVNLFSDLTVAGTSTFGNVQIAGNNIGLASNANLLTLSNNSISISGDLSVGGNATFTGNILPSADNIYTLGSDTNRWKDLYLGPNSINIGVAGNYALLGYSTTSNYLSFNPSGNGISQFVMTDTGYLGIGTTTPSQALTLNGNIQFDGDGNIMADTVVNFNTSINVGGTVTSSNGFAVGNTTVVNALGNISGDRVDEVVSGRSTYNSLNDRFNAITANYSSILSNASLFSDSFQTTTNVNTSNTTAAYNSMIGTIQNNTDAWTKIDINYGTGDNIRSISGTIVYGNKLYVATYGYGIKVLNLDTEAIVGQWTATSTPSLAQVNFTSIAYDYDRNDIYAGFYSAGPGLVKIDVDANTITTYTTANGLKSNTIGNQLGNVMQYYNGKVYLFPSGSYMQVFNVVSGTFTDYDNSPDSGLPSGSYYDVQAYGNELHISTSVGFYIWNMDTDTLVKRYYSNGPQGLYNYTNVIYSSWQDPDDSDIVWLSSASSWQKLSKTNGWQEFHRVDQEISLNTSLYWIRKIGGQLWFGGYSSYRPDGYLVYDLNAENYFVISGTQKILGNAIFTSSYHQRPLYYNGYYYFSIYAFADIYKSQLAYEASNIFETNVIVSSANNITSAKLTYSGGVGTGNSINWYLSADNGVHWEGPVTPNVLWEFTNIGTQVKAKAVMTAGVGTTPIIRGITVTAFDGDTWAGEGSNTVETEVLQARNSSSYGIFGSLDLRLEDIDTKISLAVTSTHTHDDRYLQVSGGTVSGSVIVSGNITSNNLYTSADSTYNLGTSTAYWLNTYSDNLYLNSTAYLSGTTAGAIAVNGNLGVGTSSPSSKLDVYVASPSANQRLFNIGTSGNASRFSVDAEGDYFYDGTGSSPSADYAEYFYTTNIDLVSGEVVCIDVSRNNSVIRCNRSSDTNIMGVVSTKPALLGNAKEEYRDNNNYKMIALLGQIPGRVSNENGNINPGDSLTSGSRSGYLMKANPGDSTVGIALESLSASEGSINVLISRRNKSLTVEQIESQITDRIANMEIEDEVAIMISNAIGSYNFASTTQILINDSLATVYSSLDQTSDTVAILADEINKLKGLDYKTNVWDFISDASSMGNLYQVNLQTANSYGFGDFNDIYVTGENATGYSIYNKLSTVYDGKAQTAFGNYTELQTSDEVDVNYGSYIVSASDSKAGTQIGQYINLNSASTTNWAIFVDNLGGKSYFGDNVLVGSEVPVLSWTEFNMTGDDLFVKGDIGIGGNMFVDGALSVKGNAEFLGDLLVIGDIYSSGSFKSSNSGYAQMMELTNSNFEYGDVVVLNEGNSVKLSDRANSSNILGIIAEKPAFISGNSETGKPIVTMGASLVNVTASNGLIKKGDYLTTSNEPGKAQKASKLGAGVIGIAMEDMEGGHDQIAISVQIGYFNNHVNTIEVAKTGGDFDNILSAMSSITDNSESKRYVINIKSGEYSETITLKPYVDVICENSSSTIIIGSSAPAVIGANNSRIENCSLKSIGSASNVSVVSIAGSGPVINNNRIISEVASGVGINIENTTAGKISPVISENEFIGSMSQGIVNFASDNDMIVMNNNIQNVTGSAIATLNGVITSSGNIFKGMLVDINIGENGKLFSTNDKFETLENIGTFIDFTGNGNKLAHYVIDGFMLESTSINSLVASLSSGEAYVNGTHISIKPIKQITLLPNVDNYIYISNLGEILVTSERSDENKVLLSTAKTDASSILAISNDRQNEVVVAKQGGDYTSISEALSKIKLNSANNRWLITVKPGIYNEQVTLIPFVDIVGSGRENTRITQINRPAVVAASKSSISNITLANYADEIGQEVVSINAVSVTSTEYDKFSFAMTNVLVDYNKSSFAPNYASSSAIKITSGLDNENLSSGSTSSVSLVDLKLNSVETRNADIAINWNLYDENWSATSTSRLLSHIDISNSRLSSNYSDIRTRAFTGDIISSTEYLETINAVSLISSSYNLYSGSNLSFDLGSGTKLTTSHDNYGKVVGSNALILNDFNRNVAQYDDLWVLQNNGSRIMSVNGNGNILMSPQNVALDSFSMSQNISSTTLTVVASENNIAANFFGRVVISPTLNASGTSSGIAELMFSSDGVISANGNKLQVGKSGDTVDLNVEGVAYILPDSAVRDTITAYVDVPRVDTRVWGNGENSWKPAEDIKILKLKAQYKCGDGGSITLRLEDKNNSELAIISGGNCSNGYANIESGDLNINLTSEDGMHVVVTQISGGGEESEGPSQLTITVEYVYRRDLASGNSNKNNN